MFTDHVFLLGAGGHGKVVLDALLASGTHPCNIHIRDDATHLRGEKLLDYFIEVPALATAMAGSSFHISVGTAEIRRRMFAAVSKLGVRALTVVHPSASVSHFSNLGAGCFVAARSVIAPGVTLGVGVIVNHGAIVDHDCSVGNFSHIAPNATLGGAVRIGACVLIGAGANILPGIAIGDGAVVGAGAVITADVDAYETHVGVPAKKIIGN